MNTKARLWRRFGAIAFVIVGGLLWAASRYWLVGLICGGIAAGIVLLTGGMCIAAAWTWKDIDKK